MALQTGHTAQDLDSQKGISLFLRNDPIRPLIPAQITAVAVMGGIVFAEVFQKKGPATPGRCPVGHHLIQLLKFIGLPQMKLREIHRKLRRSPSGKESNTPAAKRRNIGPFVSLFQIVDYSAKSV